MADPFPSLTTRTCHVELSLLVESGSFSLSRGPSLPSVSNRCGFFRVVYHFARRPNRICESGSGNVTVFNERVLPLQGATLNHLHTTGKLVCRAMSQRGTDCFNFDPSIRHQEFSRRHGDVVQPVGGMF